MNEKAHNKFSTKKITSHTFTTCCPALKENIARIITRLHPCIVKNPCATLIWFNLIVHPTLSCTHMDFLWHRTLCSNNHNASVYTLVCIHTNM